jgi:flavorubredoxin
MFNCIAVRGFFQQPFAIFSTWQYYIVYAFKFRISRESAMQAIKIRDGIYRISANIGNKDLFEGIWPIPNGVSLNSYLVKGEKTALIDLVKDWDDAPGQIEGQLVSAGVSFGDLDYLVINHMEPDHTGWLRELRGKNPGLKILASKKSIPLLKNFYGIEEGVQAVGSGDKLELGDGKTLVFEDAPNVHWPETMVTWEASSEVLFSCDAFGAFGAMGNKAFQDELSASEKDFFERETIRYYANIISTFSPFVERAIKKLEGLEIDVVAPSHGPIWRENPKEIIDNYGRYASWMKGPALPEITVVWSSMYGNTRRMVDPVVEGIESEGVPVHIHRIPQEHVSFVLADAWRSTGIVLGMPTYEYKMFPPMAHVLDILERSHVQNRLAFRFGSYGWSGGAQKQLDEFTGAMKWDCMEPLEFAGAASAEDLDLGRKRGAELARRVKELCGA